MPHELEYVVDKAVMMCNQGAKPNYFRGTHNENVKINHCKVCITTDKLPIENIPEFGACAKTGGPCQPLPLIWSDTYRVKVKGQQTLLYSSKLPCSSGGEITFVTSGQIPVSEEELGNMMDEHAEEEEEEGWGWWDTAELVPVVGSVIGIVRSAAKGDGLMVAANVGFLVMDVAGAVSFGATTAASTGLKTAAKVGVKATAKAGVKAAGKVLTKQGAKALAKAAAKHVDDIAGAAGKICVFACFAEGTLIKTRNGQKPIENIETGDFVWAYHELDDQVGLQQVVAITQQEVDVTLTVQLENEEIETTSEHPFFTQQGWKEAADLTTSDLVRTFDKVWKPVNGLIFNYQSKKVYNFEVANWHSYFVGSSAWLVHNAQKVCLSKTLSLLKYWKPKFFKVGELTIRLDKKTMTHIIERHLKGFRSSADKATQTMIKNMSPRDIENAIGEVIKQNRDKIFEMSKNNPNFRGQIKGVVDGVERTVGFKNGNVGQFY